jgi:hypothetical protein
MTNGAAVLLTALFFSLSWIWDRFALWVADLEALLDATEGMED